MQSITILGATGSIGCQTLDVLALHPDRYVVHALTANQSWQKLAEQCLQHKPRFAVLADESAATSLRNYLQQAGSDTEVLFGSEAAETVAAEAQVVMAAIVGAAGVLPTLAAAKAGRRVLLANKEALVVTGHLFMAAVNNHGAELIPVDSEHSAIYQCLMNKPVDAEVERIILTASGGPFRQWSQAQLESVTVEQALKHPNWEMGPKITVDSATLMNKGLELIEACWLFNVPETNIDVVVHPQSVVHSMVSYRDGSVMAQLGTPDMKTPIAVALAWPERIESGASRLNFYELNELTFEQPDTERFPCLRLAREAMQAGGTASAVLNAANEEAVAAFLDRRLPFSSIAAVVTACLEKMDMPIMDELEQVLALDQQTRQYAQECIKGASC